tara:strand:+ start:642 stop:1460 length:819 start_codon:yes stop_codon:yes gene_type:complete
MKNEALQENAAFVTFNNEDQGCLLDDSNHSKYPIRYYNVINGIGLDAFNADCSYYGFIYEGTTDLISVDRPAIKLEQGMYFSIVGPFLLNPTCQSKLVIVEVCHTKGIYPQNNYKAMFNVGGKIEEHGRLNYIDGCTDSLLIPPIKMGDPCFNHLHFPPAISQTPHTHPSHRIGLVVKGNGLCVTPFGNLILKEGMIFVIKQWDGKEYKKGQDGKDYEVGNHCFYTYENSMDVVAFHPDSDFGATDINHPMINRTIVDGISANQIKDIQTKS